MANEKPSYVKTVDYGNDFKNLTLSDSWKEKTVELAATGAIVATAGSLAAKGNLRDSAKYGKQALKQAGKGFENYIKRKSNPATKLIYNTGKKTMNSLSKKETLSNKSVLEEALNKRDVSWNSIKERDVIAEASKRQANLENQQRHIIEAAKAEGKTPPPFQKVDPIRMQEEVKQEMFENSQKIKDTPFTPKKNFVPKDKEGFSSVFLGSAMSGLGFGAGITALHAIDKASQTTDNKKKNETYEYGGSFIRSERKDKMKKTAGIRHMHDSFGELGSKIPQAAATGLGFTGVSLGTASILNKKKDEQEGAKRNRIIIELGEDEFGEDSAPKTTMGGLSLLPKPDFNKTSSFKGYLKNLGGRKDELTLLNNKVKDFDYHDAASNSLRGQDVDLMAKNRFGHILNDEKSKERLLESEVKKLQNADKQSIDNIKDAVAKDRVYTGASAGAAGIGIAGLANLPKKKEEAITYE